MLTTKISTKGQVVVPKEVRAKLKIKPGTFFHVQVEKNTIILTPMKKRPIDRLYGRFADEKILDELEREHATEIENEDRP
ncbi:MAG TPA: AbrB/MazE/SpoVT family DNA-binding domain-containing protein [Desulfatiglandales bacterium]|nr:AbrB/MazE/SpoVT family DNA-binding domain-containing protein [Desulfatiglandales bacterium]